MPRMVSASGRVFYSVKHKGDEQLCACGCGHMAGWTVRNGRPNKYIKGHSSVRHGCKRRGGATPEYQAYTDARKRTKSALPCHAKYYKNRGVTFLFTSFAQWLQELGPRPSPAHSVDRYPDPDGNYEPGNVRWATHVEQRNNHRVQLERATDHALLAEVRRRGLI